MTAIIIILILVVLWLLLGSRISSWIRYRINRFVANRTEDFIRKATGMPPREKKSSRRKTEKNQRQTSSASSGQYSHRSNYYYDPDGPIIPKEYAEDVEFVEVKEFSQTDIDARFADGSRVEYHESQVSDAEWVEVKS